MKHAKNNRNSAKQKQIKLLKILTVLLVAAIAGAAITIYRDYQARPGFLEKVWISERGADHLTVSWEKVRNVDKYVITCDGKSMEVSGRKASATVDGLAENTDYEVGVRADSKERKGFEVVSASARTKKMAHITGEDRQMKFANMPADLMLTAETAVIYEPGHGYTVTPDGRLMFSRPGEVKVTAVSEETEEYAPITKEISVTVLDTVPADPAGAAPRTIYKLNKENCECVTKVIGDGQAIYPQSFVYYDGKYIIAFVKKGDGVQRIITYGNKREVYKPEGDIGHANGMTIADGRCYTVRGGGSKKCVTFEPPNSNFSSFDLEYGATGIAYDPIEGMFYTTSRAGIVAYDKAFSVDSTVKLIRHKNKTGLQDCGAYNGILMNCMSGENLQGTNYIDFYNMDTEKYLGTVECELNELEGIIVDDDGFLELLSLGRDGHSIWKTPINMKQLSCTTF